MQSLPSGGVMAAVFTSASRLATALEPYQGRITIAARNAPESTVVSGDEDAVAQLLASLEAQGIKSKTLATSHAFHSHRMDSILEPLDRVAQSVACSAPRIDIVSNLTGAIADSNTFA
jgi:acyl transferase domain-containing protein